MHHLLQALASVDVLCCDRSSEMQLPHSASAKATFLDGLDPLRWTKVHRNGGSHWSCGLFNVLLVVAVDSAQREFAAHLQVADRSKDA
jgi:hypothetical protein